MADAGILVDPDDMGQIARALMKVTEDEAVREELIRPAAVRHISSNFLKNL